MHCGSWASRNILAGQKDVIGCYFRLQEWQWQGIAGELINYTAAFLLSIVESLCPDSETRSNQSVLIHMVLKSSLRVEGPMVNRGTSWHLGQQSSMNSSHYHRWYWSLSHLVVSWSGVSEPVESSSWAKFRTLSTFSSQCGEQTVNWTQWKLYWLRQNHLSKVF
jgi:hypothetical protein